MFTGLTSLKKFPLKAVYTFLSVTGLICITLIVFSPYIPYSIALKINDIAEDTIVSHRFIEFKTEEDSRKTEELQNNRVALIKPVFTIDENINKSIQSNIIAFFTCVKDYKEKNKNTPEYKKPAKLNFIPAKKLYYLTSLDKSALSSIEYVTIDINKKILMTGLSKIDSKNIKELFKKNTTFLDLNKDLKDILFNIIINFIRPNMVLNQAKTKAAAKEARDSIKPLTTILKEGQPIIYKGEKVTKRHIEILKALNIYGVKANVFKLAGISLTTFLLFLLLERFVYYFNFKLYVDKKYFILTYFIILLVVALARLFQLINFFPGKFSFQFIIPIPMAAMLLSIMVAPGIAMLCGALISVFVAIMYKADLFLFLYLFFANCVATFASYKKYTNSNMIFAGNIAGLFNVLMVLTTGLFQEVNDPWWFMANMGLAFLNGIVSAMIALAVLPYCESLFKIITPQKLLEFSNLNHPLLKHVLLAAPGTYQHSLMVANLAETAAESINANPIIARVGAYFHDIGKIKRPVFFSENQLSGENPHETLSPRMSKKIIFSHVKDGLELASKHKLPDIIKQFINEHHGTTLVSFFYKQVIHTEEVKNTESTKEEFRYSGSKPSFKESGIVMLADSIEAAAKSMEKPTPAKIENLINRIFKEKIDDGQLDICPLTLKEIHNIKKSFLSVFKGIFHSRLDYEEELKNIIEKSKTNGKK